MKIIDWNKYTFRCSQLGSIISKSGKLTQGIETALLDLFISETEQIDNDINSKYFDKGLFEEESGITMLNDTLYKDTIIVKNKKRYFNDFINGEHDCLAPSQTVYDIKNAWDTRTFHKSKLTEGYEWQLVGYAWLLKVKKARLFYCLNNTPTHLVADEEKRIFYKGGFTDFEDKRYIAECENMYKKHNHDSKPLSERFRLWDIDLTDDKIDTIILSVNAARKYLTSLQEKRVAEIEKNSKLMGQEFSHINDNLHMVNKVGDITLVGERNPCGHRHSFSDNEGSGLVIL